MKTFQAHIRRTPWPMATALSVVLAACGGGGQEPIMGAGSVSPVVAPTVTVVTPSGAFPVALNTKIITAAFSTAMNPATLTAASFTLACQNGPVTTGPVSYLAASKLAILPLTSNLPSGNCTATVTTAVQDNAGVSLASNYQWTFTTSASPDTTATTVLPVTNPASNATGVATNSAVKVTFGETIDPRTVNATNFTLAKGVNPVAGTVSINPLNNVATFTPSAPLLTNTSYTATVTGATDQAGNLLAVTPWTFSTAATAATAPLVVLNMAQPFGTFGGSAGMTNTGILTVVNGDIGTIATGNAAITGFYEDIGFGDDVYTAKTGMVKGVIYTCATSTTGANSVGASAPDCAVARQARLDAQTAYQSLVATPVGGKSAAPGANLAGTTLLPGTYVAPGGSFLVQGGNLTLDAQGDANATWVFQMASTLTVGGPGAAAPQSIILAGGALAKNVFWQVGSTATINAAGGGTMVGTIIAQEGVNISTAGNVNTVTLSGRALSLGASVTMVNTVINVPAQ